MYKYHLSVVLPIYNEEGNIKELHQKLSEVLFNLGKTYELIFTDDGSKDNSYQLLKEIAAVDSQVKVIKFRRNFGQTAALAAGIDEAQGEIIITIDSDLENDPEDIPKLLQKINEGYDIVSGWRKKRWQNKLFTRKLTSGAANWLTRKISGVNIHDLGCTLKAYRSEVIKGVKLYGEMHRFIAILAYWQGGKMCEVEVNFQPRKCGKSTYGMERILKVMLDLVTIKYLSSYSTKPIYFFGKAGFYSFILGVITFLMAIYFKLFLDASFIQTPLPTLTALFVIVGIQFILIGLVADLVMRNYYESQDKPIYLIKEKINLE
jgi:glycosyltransferase involved in cell wall biosynthesis